MLIKTFSWVDIILYICLFGLRRVRFRLVRVGVGWVAGLNENITNSDKLKLELELSLATISCHNVRKLLDVCVICHSSSITLMGKNIYKNPIIIM